MPRHNTAQSYGSVTRTIHWLTALMIAAMFALGIIATRLAHRITAAEGTPSDALISWAKLLFSTHKTLGIALFALALLRILWALRQPRPGLLNGDNRLESHLATTVHWLLYGSLVMVPLSGWVHHAASTGFAPIWWPLGQGLPFVPKDVGLSEIAGTLHYLLQWVLAGAIGLHVAGALKHHVIDRDATLRRMLTGLPAHPTTEQPGHALPLLAALAIWGVVIGGAAGLGWFSHAKTDAAPALERVASGWQVQDGALGITITQLGSQVSGQFGEWTAAIRYDPVANSEGQHGSVEVTVAIASLTLGTVTDQAMGPDYFDVGTWPTAVLNAELVASDEGGLIADGTLRIRDQSVPVQMPVALQIDGDIATASGALQVDRRNFQIGQGVSDAGSLGFDVQIDWQLRATRAP